MTSDPQTDDEGRVSSSRATEHQGDEESRVFPAHIAVHFKKDPGEKLDFIQKKLSERQFDPQSERVLVFVFTRRAAEHSAAKFAKMSGYRSDYYHAGRDSGEKEEVATRFREGGIDVLFATKAFGMGVDVRTVRYVFHLTPPSSIEDYIQEIGRAGRDGKESSAFLPYCDSDFNDVRSRLVDTQLNWDMVKEMHKLLGAYRSSLTGAEHDSFVVPSDLIVHSGALRKNLFGAGAAATRQRMLLHSLEEAKRLKVGDYELTHWPVTLGESPSDDTSAREIRRLAEDRGATANLKSLISEQDLRQRLRLRSYSEAREQLFRASKIGAIKIPFDVGIDLTQWAQAEENLPNVRAILRHAKDFLEPIRTMDGERVDIRHDVVHPPYLADRPARDTRRLIDPVGVRFDERKPSLVRFLRRVDGLRVSGNRRTAQYTVVGSDRTNWRKELETLPDRARRIIEHLCGSESSKTIGELFRAAAGIGDMNFRSLELTLYYLAALGIVRLSSDVIPTSVRIEVQDAFAEPFDTPQDEQARDALNERNHLRLIRLDALQVLTRVDAKAYQEDFARRFFDAGSVADARRVVLEKASEVAPDLRQQFDGEALWEYYEKLTDEQRLVVCSAQKQHVVVKAGPGTGKTHTLINCIVQRIIASDRIGSRHPGGPIPERSILVLAYTRAVVEELRHRIHELLNSLGRNEIPQIHTFHSYALYKLGESGRKNVPVKEALREFAQMLKHGHLPNAPAHIFVDEFQDITGQRLDMLRAIRARSTGTLVTVIGDPDQSIYDYDRSEGDKTSAEETFQTFAAELSAGEPLSLSINFRSDNTILDHANKISAHGLKPGPNAGLGGVINLDLAEVTGTLDSDVLVQHAQEALGQYRQVAVLFRTNPELYTALQDLRNLAEQEPGVVLRVLGGKGRIVYSREINEALETLAKRSPTDEVTEELVHQVAKEVYDGEGRKPWEPRLFKHLIDGAWMFMGIEGGKTVQNFIEWVRDDLDGNQLLYASRLRRSQGGGKELILSTMHRTKGLEFDSVIVAPSDMPLKKQQIEEENRLRYVAVTRARHYLGLLNGPREKALSEGQPWEGKDQIRGRRFDTIDAEGAGAFRLYDFSHQEEYLWRRVREGDQLRIEGNRLWHDEQRLCNISSARTKDFPGQPLTGIFVSEVVRHDGFGKENEYKDRYHKDAQKRGWCYIINAAGYLK